MIITIDEIFIYLKFIYCKHVFSKILLHNMNIYRESVKY